MLKHPRHVKQAFAARNRRNINIQFFFKALNKLPECTATFDKDFIINCKTFRDCFNGSLLFQVNFAKIRRLVFCLFNVVGLAENEERKCQVDERVPKLFNGVESLDKLVNLDANNSSDHCGGCGDCGDNFSCNHLCLTVVALSDLVVACSEAGNGVDEVYVEIFIVIFFKLCALDLSLANNLCVIGQRILNLNQLTFIIFRPRLLWWGLFSFLSCLLLFRRLNFNHLWNVRFAGYRLGYLFHNFTIELLLET